VGRAAAVTSSLVVALAALTGCPADGEPPAATESATPEPPWTLYGGAMTYDGAPVSGMEVASGDVLRLTDAQGLFQFEAPDGPPIQVDRTVSEVDVSSRITCDDELVWWIWQGGSSSDYAYVEIRISSWDDLADLTLLWVYEDPDGGWLSTWSFGGSSLGVAEDGSASATFWLPDAARWTVIAAEMRAYDQLGFARAESTEPLLVDDEITVDLELQRVEASWQTWDGVAPEGVQRVEFRERIEVWGSAAYVKVASVEPTGEPVELPVLDGRLDVMEYQVDLTWDEPACDTARTWKTLDPVFPPDVLTIPTSPPAPTVAVDGAWADGPTLVPAPLPGTGNNYVYFDAWDAEGEATSSWDLRYEGGCGETASWPVRLPTPGVGDSGRLQITSYGDEWSGRCSSNLGF